MPIEVIKEKYENDTERLELIAHADNLIEGFDSIYKSLIKFLAKKFDANEISAILHIPMEKLEDLIEEIEDEELFELANAVINKYGGLEGVREHSISHEELLKELGITEEDLENAEDPEIEYGRLEAPKQAISKEEFLKRWGIIEEYIENAEELEVA